MTKKIIWRLREPPTSESLRDLVISELLSKDEAREILFSSETDEDRDKKSLESEIKFLRELVEKFAQGNNSRIVEIIREVQVQPYPTWRQYPWWNTYNGWCTTIDIGSGITVDGTTLDDDIATNTVNTVYTNFSDVKTF